MNQRALKKSVLPQNMRKQVVFRDFEVPLWIALLCFFALVLARDIAGISVPRIIITLVCGVFFLLLPENEDFAFFFSIIPFSPQISFNEIALLFLVTYFLRRFHLHYPRQLFFIVCVFLIELFNILFASGNLRIGLQFSVLLFIGALLVVAPMKKEQIAVIIKSYIFAVVVVCLDVFYVTFSRISLDEFFLWGYRFGRLRFIESSAGSFTSFDPNELAVQATTSFYLLTMLWYTKRVPLMVYLPVSGFLLFAYAMTQSRGGLFALILFLVVFWLGSFRNFSDFLRLSFGYFVIAGILFALCAGPLAGLYERFVYRFSVDDITSGRTGLWQGFLQVFFSDPKHIFFGYGSRHYSSILLDNRSAHNTLFDIVASWGVVGLGCIISWHVFLLRKQLSTVGKRIPLPYFAPFLAVFLNSLSLQFYLVTVLSLIMTLTELSIRLAEYDECHFMPAAQAKAFYRSERRSPRRESRRIKNRKLPLRQAKEETV